VNPGASKETPGPFIYNSKTPSDVFLDRNANKTRLLFRKAIESSLNRRNISSDMCMFRFNGDCFLMLRTTHTHTHKLRFHSQSARLKNGTLKPLNEEKSATEALPGKCC